MEELAKEKWEKAINHAKEMKFMGQSIGPAGIFYVMGCNELIERYEKRRKNRRFISKYDKSTLKESR